MAVVCREKISISYVNEAETTGLSDCIWGMGKNGKMMKISKFLVEMTG